MQSMQLCICSVKQFEETFKNSLWWKNIQMQLMWLGLCSVESFEDTFENSLRWKVVQKQLCICPGSRQPIWGHIWKFTQDKSATKMTYGLISAHCRYSCSSGVKWNKKEMAGFYSFLNQILIFLVCTGVKMHISNNIKWYFYVSCPKYSAGWFFY